MKKISIILTIMLSVLTLVGCTNTKSETTNSTQSTFSAGDKPTAVGYEEEGMRIDGNTMIMSVVLSKNFSQKELEDIVSNQNIKGEKIVFNFYQSKKEIEDKKEYTVAQITVENGKMTYKSAK
ncbi:MAG: hypothetical protein ACRCV7_04395 [Culicoidibacterales bacterium]